ncbi:MAG TPA: hypothetical protein VJ727_01445 [Rhodanobacteraceae bacterium]|nr:hypothetical protein [Rhodanobacteraceae bacterium]
MALFGSTIFLANKSSRPSVVFIPSSIAILNDSTSPAKAAAKAFASRDRRWSSPMNAVNQNTTNAVAPAISAAHKSPPLAATSIIHVFRLVANL